MESRSSQILSKVQVAAPCPANWREMAGDDRVRHCTHCARNVYNISNMSRKEAADLIKRTEGRLCVRYYTKPDGTILTRDCGQKIRSRMKFLTYLAPILGAFGLSGISAAIQNQHGDAMMGDVAVSTPTLGKLAVPTMGALKQPSGSKPAKVNSNSASEPIGKKHPKAH